MVSTENDESNGVLLPLKLTTTSSSVSLSLVIATMDYFSCFNNHWVTLMQQMIQTACQCIKLTSFSCIDDSMLSQKSAIGLEFRSPASLLLSIISELLYNNISPYGHLEGEKTFL